MKDLQNICKIAVVQAAPVMFDKTKSTDKAVKLIAEAAEQGAELIVFPELFIAGYPYGMTYGCAGRGIGAACTGGKTGPCLCQHRRI